MEDANGFEMAEVEIVDETEKREQIGEQWEEESTQEMPKNHFE